MSARSPENDPGNEPGNERPASRRRWWLRLLALPVAVATLIALALLVFVLTVDPSRFRGNIEAKVQEQTGLKLQLQGQLHWRLWPLLAIESEGGALQAPLLSWKHLVFTAPLSDVLNSRWNLKSLQVEGLRLDLRRDAQGHGNWELPDSGGPAAPLKITLKELVLKDAMVSYQDARGGSPVTGSSGTGASWVVGPLGLTLDDVAVDRQPPDTQLAVSRLELDLADSTLHASVQGRIAGDAAKTALQGHLELQTASLRTLLRALGSTPPATSDDNALGATQFTTDWTLTGPQLQAAVQLRLDDTKLAGKLAADLASAVPQLQVNLKGDAVNFDRYMPPDAKIPDATTLKAKTPAAAQGVAFKLPIVALKSLPVMGVIELESAQGNGVTLKGVKLRLENSP